MKDYRVKIKISNARIYRAMKEAGYETVAQLCQALSLSQTTVGKVFNMNISPLKKDGEWRKEVIILCDAFKKMPTELFSEDQMAKWDKTTGEVDLDIEQIDNLVSENLPILKLENNDMQLAIEDILQKLSDRESSVLRRRFGIEGEEMTLSAIAIADGVSAARVRQIEAEALRKLRNKARNAKLIDCLTAEASDRIMLPS